MIKENHAIFSILVNGKDFSKVSYFQEAFPPVYQTKMMVKKLLEEWLPTDPVLTTSVDRCTL